MIKPIRRIVTGHNARGRSMIASDGPSPHVLTLPSSTAAFGAAQVPLRMFSTLSRLLSTVTLT